ncbi:cystathionine beta-lyase [Flavobacteriaceae bacterium UJ101]|nr:cystathionine beta-lyase [Flavobacteriaceae bacterium UJ101]
MNQFDQINKNFEHKFAKENPRMLHYLFETQDVLPFWIADMDFTVAEPITKELKRLVDRSIYAYEFDAQSIFKAIVEWNKNRHNLFLDYKNFIQIPGVLTGIALLIRELTELGDGILIQTPVYHQFAQVIKKSGRKIIQNPLQIVDGEYKIDFIDLEQKLQSGKVKMILLCNPHNPIGRVWKLEELQKVVDLANQYNVRIISDEIHSDIIYSGHQFTSILSFNDSKHIALLGSPAKTFGMQSISNGYLYISDDETREQLKHTVESMHLNHGNAFTTFATIAAYQKGGPWLDDLISYLEETLSWIKEYLKKELPLITMYPAEGTYQIWLDFTKLNLSDDELKDFLVKKAKLGFAPGSWFDQNYGQFMRMNIASPLIKIQNAFKRLKTVYDENL